MCGRFRHLKPEFQLIDFCIPGFRHESSTMRFKGQFSQPVVQGGIRMPGTSHAAPTCKRKTTSARSSVGGACILRLHFFATNRPTAAPRAFDPKSKARGAYPAAMDPKRGPDPTAGSLDTAIETPRHRPQTRCCNPGQRAAGQLPVSGLGHRPGNRGAPRSHDPQHAARPMPAPPATISHYQKDGLKSLQVRGENDRTHALPNETHAGASRRLDICARRRARRAQHVRPGLGFTREPAINCYPNPLNLGSCSCPNHPTSC